MIRMTLRSILLHPDPRLKSVADPVATVDKTLHALADDMLETMYDAPGIGLAAPQLGIMQRMLVMDCIKDDMETPQPMVLINPRVIAASSDTNIYDEGCLSIPDQYAEVERPALVKVEWTGLDGKLQQEEFADLWATCVQHEIDHLNGKLFIDYLKPLKRQMITRKMQKLKREIARGNA
jgi:peptide deformylase